MTTRKKITTMTTIESISTHSEGFVLFAPSEGESDVREDWVSDV